MRTLTMRTTAMSMDTSMGVLQGHLGGFENYYRSGMGIATVK